MSTPAIPDVIRKNNSRFTATATEIEDNDVIENDEYTQYDATQVASEYFDVMGAIEAIAAGAADFKAGDEEAQQLLDGMEAAFHAGALFAQVFAGEVEDDPALIKMGFQTFMLAQLANAGRL